LRPIVRKGFKDERVPLPDLLVVQVESFKRFLQEGIPPKKREKKGLQGVFLESFPIEDVQGRHSLEFVEYEVGTPKYTPEEAKRKKLTYSAPLWAKLRLVRKNPSKNGGGEVESAIEQKVYLCELP
jgi:DNA-directed RNA polymerase subunit beta